MKQYNQVTLSNGIRVVHQQLSHTNIIHCGIFLGIGSRDETYQNQGIAHFWEHMAFKGTKKRTSLDIITALDAVGGELNAYTDKEKIVFFSSVRLPYFKRAVDLLSDIAFHSELPAKELNKEKSVILEEMSMYEDNPEDSLQDEFEKIIFGSHPMGMNILGRRETVSQFQRKDFFNFFESNLQADKIVFSCVGNISFAEVEKICKQYLGKIKFKNKVTTKRIQPTTFIAQQNLLKPIKQSKVALGGEAFSLQNQERVPFFMLTNLLGGPGMNSRLNLSIREKHGYVYAIDAHFIPYSDCGMFAIFFGTEPKQVKKCMKLVHQELEKLMDKPMLRSELTSLKEQIKGQMALSEENNLNVMMMMGRSLLDYNRVPSLTEVFKKIDAVTSKQIQQVAQQVFQPEKISTLIMHP